jgi:hypothetical protein
MTLAFALIWGGGVGLVALLHLADPTYGTAFLNMLSSVYPGFHGATNINDALAGVVFALIDGAIGGCIFAVLYNIFAGHSKRDPSVKERPASTPAGRAA